MPSLDIENLESIDESQVSELLNQPGGESSLYHRLHGIFIYEGPDLVSELRRLVQEGSRSEIHDVFHKIKGSSAAMGAKRIHALAAHAVQVCLEDGEPEMLAELPDLIEAEYSRYSSEAQRFL